MARGAYISQLVGDARIGMSNDSLDTRLDPSDENVSGVPPNKDRTIMHRPRGIP